MDVNEELKFLGKFTKKLGGGGSGGGEENSQKKTQVQYWGHKGNMADEHNVKYM